MGANEDQVLRAAKEVAVKFIEMGRISPANFSESFQMIYEAIEERIQRSETGTTDHKQKKR
ncbi:MAG: hypothetical protein AB1724_00300 [Thermodesulfobacteriota bacterium]